MTSNLLPSAEVARRLSIKTQTLAAWRCKGKGPKGWIHISATRVAYPEEEVEVFIRTLVDRRPVFNFRKPTAPKIAVGSEVTE
jgi:hypothetical protein